jgi:hypothetical protein
MRKYFITSFLFLIFFVLIFTGKVYSQDSGEQGTKLNLTGSMRFRGFSLSRDIPTARSTNSTFIYDIPGTYNTLANNNYTAFKSNYDRLITGQKINRSPRKENLNYMDSRLFLNLEFITSKYFDGVFGATVGDIPFGGRALTTTGNTADLRDSYTVGAGSGGETGQPNPVNFQTSLLYLNFRLRQYDFYSRLGIQLFSSPQGRVFFASGAGILLNKDYKIDKYSLEGGWIRTRERSVADLDNNGYNDKSRNINVFFGKIRLNKINNLKNELYTYGSVDNDTSDLNRETGNLYWHGLFNEYTISNFNIILHGVYNHGKVKAANSLVDGSNTILMQKENTYNIRGALGDVQLTYFYNNKVNFNTIVVGTTGRPGYDKDGMEASYKNKGYRTLSPLFSVSNLAIDFTGGYTLFSARNMSGLVEYGGFTNVIVGPVQLTFGYYQLHASQAPRIAVNRDFMALRNSQTSNYLGDEYNFNLRWNIFIDFQLIFRSGIFFPKNGIRAIIDYSGGSYIQEAFLSGEYKF